MIVVEGFDTSGKSTLADAIGAEFKLPVLHTGGPTTSISDVMMCLARSEARLHERCVQDRITHVSESVYSMLTAPSKAALAIARLEKLSDAWVVIYCRPPRQVMLDAIRAHELKNHDTPEFISFVAKNSDHLITIYDTIMTRVSNISGIRFIMYDRTVPGAAQLLIDTVKRITDHAR